MLYPHELYLKETNYLLELYIPWLGGGSDVTASHEEGTEKFPVFPHAHVKLPLIHQREELRPHSGVGSGKEGDVRGYTDIKDRYLNARGKEEREVKKYGS